MKTTYVFAIKGEGNDDCCIYEQKEETVKFLSDTEVEAINMMIQHCLDNGYQKFEIVKMFKNGVAVQ